MFHKDIETIQDPEQFQKVFFTVQEDQDCENDIQ